MSPEDPVRADILRLFRANPLLRDTIDVIAMRAARKPADVQKVLDALEEEGLVSRRWVGETALYYFTGAPETTGASPQTASRDKTNRSRKHKPTTVLEAVLRVPSTLDGVTIGREAAEQLCRIAAMSGPSIVEFNIALSEALTNAYRYGRRGDGRDIIRIHLTATEEEVVVDVKDRGSGFPSLLVGTSQGDRQSTGGRGLMLMRSLTDGLSVTRSETGATVRLVKRLKKN